MTGTSPRGEHYGQRPCKVPHQQAAHIAAPDTKVANAFRTLDSKEPSTHSAKTTLGLQKVASACGGEAVVLSGLFWKWPAVGGRLTGFRCWRTPNPSWRGRSVCNGAENASKSNCGFFRTGPNSRARRMEIGEIRADQAPLSCCRPHAPGPRATASVCPWNPGDAINALQRSKRSVE